MSQTTTATDEMPPVNETAAPQEEPFQPSPAVDQAAELRAEADKWKDTALRTAAELDNYRKRVAREMQDARAFANADLLRSLIPVMDNFEMGLEAARAENDKSVIFQGMSMVGRQIADFLRDQGVEEVNALGQKFDPNLHEAMSQEPSAEHAEGTVLKVVRRGFRLKDRLDRAFVERFRAEA